jgi:hypothetical protein
VEERTGIKVALDGLLVCGFRLIEMIKSHLVAHEKVIRDWKVWIQSNGFFAFFNRFIVFPQGRQNYPRQETMRIFCTRIRLLPKLAALFCLFHISSGSDMKGSSDQILLRLAGSVAEFVSLSGVVSRSAQLSNISIHTPQHRVGERELRVESIACLKNGIAAADPVVPRT